MIRRLHNGHPPAGSLHARALRRRQTDPNLVPNMLLNDGSFLLGLPGMNLPIDELAEAALVQAPIPGTSLARTPQDATNPPLPSLHFSDGTNAGIEHMATPFLISPPSISDILSPTSVPDATPSPTPSFPDRLTASALLTAQTSYFPQKTALFTDASPKFTTVIVKNNGLLTVMTTSKSTPVPNPNLSATTLAFIPSVGSNFTALTTFVASTTSIPTTTSTSTHSQTTATHTSSAIPPSASSLREGGHTVIFWIGIALAAISGVILLLLGVLLLLKYMGNRRARQLWGDDFFDPTLDAAASAVISGRTVTPTEKPIIRSYSEGPVSAPAAIGIASASKPFNTSHPPHKGNGDTVSEKQEWPPKTLLASEFDGERSLQPPQALRIANHAHGDYSSDERSTLATPKRSFPDDADENELGTPRPPQAAPFLRLSLRDGGLPVPWSDSSYHSAVPTPHRQAESVPDAAELSRHMSRASQVSSRWWAEEEQLASTLPADGWAATLRSNLYATLSALSLRDNYSDPGASASVVDPFTRLPSRRSRASLHDSRASALHRADTEASKYSQESTALKEPFADPKSSSGDDRKPPWVEGDPVGLGFRLMNGQSDSGALKQARATLLGPTQTVNAAGGQKRSISGASSMNEERTSRIEEWLVRHKAAEEPEPMRTLWPSRSGRDAEISRGSGRGRLTSERPFVRRRGSSHVGGYTSED